VQISKIKKNSYCHLPRIGTSRICIFNLNFKLKKLQFNVSIIHNIKGLNCILDIFAYLRIFTYKSILLHMLLLILLLRAYFSNTEFLRTFKKSGIVI